MPVWWSIFAYMIFISAVGMMFYKSKKEQRAALMSATTGESIPEDTKTIGLFFAFLSFALLVFFVGQRSWISDTTIYQAQYDENSGNLSQIGDMLFNLDYKGSMFYILMVLFKHFINGTYNDWFTFLAAIQSIPIILLFYKYSINYLYSVFLFISGSSLIWYTNGIRQFLAAALVLLFANNLINRKSLRFFIVVFFAFFIHSSAIFWIPVYYIVNYKPWSKKFIVYSIILAVALFLYSRSSYLSDTEYSYLTSGQYTFEGVNPLRVIVMSIPAILAFTQRVKIKGKTNPYIDLCINLSVITAECYIVGMFTSGIVGRMPLYFQFFGFILLPWLIKNGFEEDMGKTINIVLIVMYFAYFYYEMVINGSGVYVSDSLNIFYWTT